MALNKKDTIDFLCIAHDGAISVVLVAYLDEHEEMESLRLMQDKLHRYLDFIESGEVYGRATEAANRTVSRTTPVRIEVVGNRQLQDPIGPRLLQHVASACRESGVEFEYRVEADSQ